MQQMSEDTWNPNGWNDATWNVPPRTVYDLNEPKTSKLLGPDGVPLQYKPQQQPIGFIHMKERK